MDTSARVRQTRRLKRRRVIERPRLFALLDNSAARVRTLIAPAGYGKTTLAEQWVARAERRAAWYTARRSSTDVAALALGLARAAAELVPGCDERLREHLRAVPNPGEHVDVLAEILGEDLAAWADNDWLVLDDYQELAASSDAERFVAELVTVCQLQLLVASRQRPAWVSERSILYGEVLELHQTTLAMNAPEAADVLGDRGAPDASGLVALANGWPAVIGLASVSSAAIESDVEVPESLYQFFAEEVFNGLGETGRAALATLAVAPLLDRELAIELLGAEAESVLSVALDVGIVVERGARLELHPLARAFVEERSEQLGLAPDESSAQRCLEHYGRRRDWDAAFELIARHRLDWALEPLLADALEDLLDTARLSTIEAWCTHASECDLEAVLFSIARAETLLRHGRLAEAQTFAEAAAASETRFTFRALSVAGRAAHLASRESQGLELYKRAEAIASSELERRDALWGQFMCAVELGLPEAAPALEQLWTGVRMSDPRDLVRATANKMRYQIAVGALDLSDADFAWELIDAVDDPLVEASFENVFANVLSYAARYEDALEVTSRLLATAERYHFDFARPYGLYAATQAHTGLRNWNEAELCAVEGLRAAREARNAHAEHIVFSAYVRLLAQQGRHSEALALEQPNLRHALPAASAEVECSRALAMAAMAETDAALSIVDRVRGSTEAVETTVLLPAIIAICALKSGNPDAAARVVALERAALATGAPDFMVAAYRSTPELLVALTHVSEAREQLVQLLRRAHDEDLPATGGHPLEPEDPRALLSPREKEVLDLLVQRLTNKQIASLLFISEATVKVHAHHIYDKLGTRSRTELAIRAAIERSDQATSATRTTGTGADS